MDPSTGQCGNCWREAWSSRGSSSRKNTPTPVEDDDGEEKASKSGKRVRYICPHGDMKAWAKHGAKLVCGEHMEPMEVNQPTPRGYRDITPTAEEAESEEPASEA